MVDFELIAVTAGAGFFVVLAILLLTRYRSASVSISDSADVGRALEHSLEARLKKQDEHILDVMTRLEVLQARVLESDVEPKRPQPVFPTQQWPVQTPAPAREQPQPPPQTSQASQAPQREPAPPDQTELEIIRLLSEHPRTSVEIKDLKGLSREHAARVMKGLYDKGLVTRNAANKPYLYGLSEAGKRYLATG